MTFAEMKARTAADLRQLAGFLEARAKAAEEGDFQPFEDLIDDKWALWGQMLLLRYAHCREQRDPLPDESLSETVSAKHE